MKAGMGGKTYTIVRRNPDTITYSTAVQAEEDGVCRRSGRSSRKSEGGRELHDVERESLGKGDCRV
jgi:hypothetical protein